MSAPARSFQSLKILLIEDEAGAAAYIKQGLTENCFMFEVATNGSDYLYEAINGDHDRMVLDVMLPRFAVLSALRTVSQFPQDHPILVMLQVSSSQSIRGSELNRPANDR